MDQRFEDDVMQDLSGEGPAVSSDEAAFEAMAAAATDGFGEESLEDDMREDTDPAANLAAEDGSGEDADDDLDLDPGFDAAEGETQDGLEAAIAEALDAQRARGVLRAAPGQRRPARGATGAGRTAADGEGRAARFGCSSGVARCSVRQDRDAALAQRAHATSRPVSRRGHR